MAKDSAVVAMGSVEAAEHLTCHVGNPHRNFPQRSCQAAEVDDDQPTYSKEAEEWKAYAGEEALACRLRAA